jgi:hypothetical protein
MLFIFLTATAFGEDFYFTGGKYNSFLPSPDQVRFTCIFNTLYRAPEDTIRVSLTILEIEYEDGRKEKTNYISWDLLYEIKAAANIYGLNKMIMEGYIKDPDKKVAVSRIGGSGFTIRNKDGKELHEYIKTSVF